MPWRFHTIYPRQSDILVAKWSRGKRCHEWHRWAESMLLAQRLRRGTARTMHLRAHMREILAAEWSTCEGAIEAQSFRDLGVRSTLAVSRSDQALEGAPLLRSTLKAEPGRDILLPEQRDSDPVLAEGRPGGRPAVVRRPGAARGRVAAAPGGRVR
jgi:hypothetical protein